VKFASIRAIRVYSKHSRIPVITLRNAIKPLSKGVQTASKKNFTAKKAFIFVHLMNAFCRPNCPVRGYLFVEKSNKSTLPHEGYPKTGLAGVAWAWPNWVAPMGQYDVAQ